jgi:predicted nucleic acid-binding Zn finger protein
LTPTGVNGHGSKVAVCVSPNEKRTRGVGVIRITTTSKNGKEVVRHYLLQLMTTFMAVLTSFKAEGGNTYVVSLKEGASHCNCESWRRGNGTADCKHIRALRALIARGEL